MPEKKVTIGKKDILIRGLTWGEKKRLKEQGHNISYLNPMADNDDLVEETIKVVCGKEFEFDSLDSQEVYDLFKEIHSLTFLRPDEEKN